MSRKKDNLNDTVIQCLNRAFPERKELLSRMEVNHTLSSFCKDCGSTIINELADKPFSEADTSSDIFHDESYSFWRNQVQSKSSKNVEKDPILTHLEEIATINESIMNKMGKEAATVTPKVNTLLSSKRITPCSIDSNQNANFQAVNTNPYVAEAISDEEPDWEVTKNETPKSIDEKDSWGEKDDTEEKQDAAIVISEKGDAEVEESSDDDIWGNNEEKSPEVERIDWKDAEHIWSSDEEKTEDLDIWQSDKENDELKSGKREEVDSDSDSDIWKNDESDSIETVLKNNTRVVSENEESKAVVTSLPKQESNARKPSLPSAPKPKLVEEEQEQVDDDSDNIWVEKASIKKVEKPLAPAPPIQVVEKEDIWSDESDQGIRKSEGTIRSKRMLRMKQKSVSQISLVPPLSPSRTVSKSNAIKKKEKQYNSDKEGEGNEKRREEAIIWNEGNNDHRMDKKNRVQNNQENMEDWEESSDDWGVSVKGMKEGDDSKKEMIREDSDDSEEAFYEEFDRILPQPLESRIKETSTKRIEEEILERIPDFSFLSEQDVIPFGY